MAQILKQSVSSQSAVSQQSVRSQSAVSQQSVSSQRALREYLAESNHSIKIRVNIVRAFKYCVLFVFICTLRRLLVLYASVGG